MTKEHLDNIRNYIVDNIIRNPDYLFSDEIRGKEDDDIDLKKGAEDTETWYGYHVQITAPKGTFKKMFEENEDNEGGD